MALIKDFTTDSGITVNYHRIMSVSKRGANRLDVVMHSYVNKSYRNLEKENDDVIIRKEEVEKQMAELDAIENKTEEQYNEWYNLIEENGTLNPTDKTYYVYDLTVYIKESDLDDLSFTDIYNSLKNVDIFIGAEDD